MLNSKSKNINASNNDLCKGFFKKIYFDDENTYLLIIDINV